jgi:hypothetical protein
MQHFLKAASGAAGAEVVPAQLFRQFFPAMYDALIRGFPFLPD